MKLNINKLHTDLERLGAKSIGASRTCNALWNVPNVVEAGEVNLPLLAKLGRKQLRRNFRGFGNQGLDRLERVLAEHGLSWANDIVYDNASIQLEGAYLVIRLKMTPHVYEEVTNLIKLIR